MIFAIIACLFASLFFSGSETALTAANKMKIQSKASTGDRNSQKLLYLISKPDQFITTILIGNNIANILLPTFVTMIAIDYGINVALATAILTVTIIILAEVLPKSIAASFPDKIAYFVSPIIRAMMILLKPITYLLNLGTGALIQFLSKSQPKEKTFSKEELRTIVDIASGEGTFEKEESHRIKGILDFRNLNVNDAIKTPRIEIVGIQENTPFEEVRDFIIHNRYTRYPIYREDMDSIIGIFHSKSLASWSLEPDRPLTDFSDMEPLVVFEFQSIELVFRKMMQERKHMAIVYDEYGGTEGLITHEDIIEVMIGQEIEDETDLENNSLVDLVNDREIICHGKLPLQNLNNFFATDIPEEENNLAGYVLKHFGRLPTEGEQFETKGLLFSVLEVDLERKRIVKVHILKQTSSTENQS